MTVERDIISVAKRTYGQCADKAGWGKSWDELPRVVQSQFISSASVLLGAIDVARAYGGVE